MTDRLTAWIDAYVHAWNSNEPADIGALFTVDALYYTEPYEEPWRGRAAIVENWLRHRDEPGETTFEWRRIAVEGETVVIRGTTRYPDRTYSNVWAIVLDAEGRCSEFTEWWMKHPG
jgi:hypothetical protein